jgi:hypothetical protein
VKAVTNLRVPQNTGIFLTENLSVPKNDSDPWRKLVIKMLKCNEMGHERDTTNAHKVSLKKPGGNSALPRPRQKRKDDFKIVLTK